MPETDDRVALGFVAGELSAEALDRLESLPVDSLWVGGHVASRNPTPEAMVGLVRLATRTSRVRVGTAVLLLPLYPPAIVAKQVADLDRATGGRVTLGVGVGGEYPQEFRACGVALGGRGRRTDEAMGLLRRFWTGEEIDHHGEFFDIDAVRIHPAPAQPGGPPLVVAGRREVAMRRAATLGDGWMPYLYSPGRYRASVDTVQRAAAEAGRDLDGFGWYAFIFVNLAATREEAAARAAAALGGTYNQDFRPMVEKVAVLGTADDVAAGLQAFVDAGARHLILASAGQEDADQMQSVVATEVLPALTVPRP